MCDSAEKRYDPCVVNEDGLFDMQITECVRIQEILRLYPV